MAPQFRRAAISIAANIAEGFRKHSKPDKIRFYNIARGSAEECGYYLILTKDLEYSDISEAKIEECVAFTLHDVRGNPLDVSINTNK